jgi:hypothetical protein
MWDSGKRSDMVRDNRQVETQAMGRDQHIKWTDCFCFGFQKYAYLSISLN